MLLNIIISLVNYIKLINRFNNIVQLHESDRSGSGASQFYTVFLSVVPKWM